MKKEKQNVEKTNNQEMKIEKKENFSFLENIPKEVMPILFAVITFIIFITIFLLDRANNISKKSLSPREIYYSMEIYTVFSKE